MDNEDLIIRIDSYLNGEMSAEECRDFEQKIEADAQLKKEVQLQKNIRHAFKQMPQMPLRQHLNNLIEENGQIFNESLNVTDIDPEFLAMSGELNSTVQSSEAILPPIATLKPSWIKKNSLWAIAASIALVTAVGIWWFQHDDNKLPKVVVQTPQLVLPVDTIKKTETPKREETEVAGQPKEAPPQYQTPQKSPIANEPDAITPLNDAEILAFIKPATDFEREQILEPTRSGQTPNVNALSRENQILLAALDAISKNQSSQAIALLQNQDSEQARYYRALAYLLTDKTRGKTALQTLANDTNLEPVFRNKIKTLLSKIK